jgi:acylphosphatase
MSNSSARLIIKGCVQGVWFRGWTVKVANKIGLSGWVRNRADGSVEAVFYGDSAKIESMIGKCYCGPAAASVEDIEVLYENIEVESGFKQISTL